MKFSKKFDEECRKFFKKVYTIYGIEFYKWNSHENETILPVVPYMYDTDDGAIPDNFDYTQEMYPSWVDWLNHNLYIEDSVNYSDDYEVFTEKFVKEVIDV